MTTAVPPDLAALRARDACDDVDALSVLLDEYREGITQTMTWIAEEYRRCIVAARCTHDAAYYGTCNGRAEAYRQAAEMLARTTGTKAPDFDQIRRDVPADGIYRQEGTA